jgi:hypothetical protein
MSLHKIELKEANDFVAALHRHHKPVIGHKFSLGAVLGEKLVGVAIVGRPVARMRDDGSTLEVTRLCTDGTKNACSFLYAASARAAFALGYHRIGTYILASETGRSLAGAGWRMIGERGGGSWSRGSRPRTDKAPTERKLLFEITDGGTLPAFPRGEVVRRSGCGRACEGPHLVEAGAGIDDPALTAGKRE